MGVWDGGIANTFWSKSWHGSVVGGGFGGVVGNWSGKGVGAVMACAC